MEMLNDMMVEAADNNEFEKAAVLRDQIRSVDGILEKQKIEFDIGLEQDVIACACDEKVACVVVFSIRNGKIVGKDDFLMSGTEGTIPHKILSAFCKQYYMAPRHIPSEIIIQYRPYDEKLIIDWLSENREHKVVLRIPENDA